MSTAFDKIRAAQTTDLGGGIAHFWSVEEREAVVFALASRRPLLVRGEPGTGKSQLARACAVELGVEHFPLVIRPRMEASDPLYSLDAVSRLAEAQVLGAMLSGTLEERLALVKEKIDPQNFQQHGVLWRAMEQEPPRRRPAHWPRAVVLLDEIDKADADLPNHLLEVLGNRCFQPPHGPMVRCAGHFPLVIATSNSERDLPPAFLRRCAVLQVQPDEADAGRFMDWLCARARAHHALAAFDAEQMRAAAQMVWEDRQRCGDRGKVGLAEFLDLLYAVLEIAGKSAKKIATELTKARPYALQKYTDLQAPSR